MARRTHTYVSVEVSAATYEEVKGKLVAAGYDPIIVDKDEIDMTGLALAKKEGEDDPLTKLVKEYLNEHANPAPDAMLRANYRTRLAKLVGVEDPLTSLNRHRK